MHRPKLRTLLLTPFLLTTTALAQVETTTVPWPSALGLGGPFRKITDGDFTGNLHLSAVVLGGVTAYFAYAPASYAAFSAIPVSGDVHDIATLADNGTIGRDRLLTVGDTGLQVAVFDESLGEFRVFDAGDPAWIGATLVESRRDAGSEWIAGVAADQRTLLTRFNNGGGWMPGFSETLPADVRDLVMLDFDRDGSTDIVAVCDDGLYGRALNGGAFPTVPSPGFGSFAAAMPAEAGPGDRLAWLFDTGSGFVLTVLDAFGADPLMPVNLVLPDGGDPDIIGIDTADLDGDDDHDVLLTTRRHAVVYLNEFGPKHGRFEPGSPDYVYELDETATPAAGNQCPGRWADFDRDGQPDLLIFLKSILSMVRLSDMHEGAGGSFEDTLDPLRQADYDGVSLNLRFEVPPALLDYSHIQVVGWHQANPVPAQPPLDDDPLFNWVVALGGSFTNHELTLRLDPYGGGGLWWTERDHVYLELRFVDLTGLNEVSASESFVLGLTMKHDDDELITNTMLYLWSLIGPLNSVAILEPPPGGLATKYVGGVVTRKIPPPSSTGGPPTVQDPVPPPQGPTTTTEWQ